MEMDFLQAPLSILFSFAFLMALVPAVYGLTRPGSPVTRIFTLAMFTIVAWILTKVLERAGITLETKLLWRNLSYIPVGLLPVFWFAMVLHFVDKAAILKGWVWALLLVIPALLNFGAWTNEWFHLVAARQVLIDTPLGAAIDTTRGPVYMLFYVYSLVLNLSSVSLLAWACRRREPLYVRQLIGFFIGQVVVIVPNFLYMMRIPPFINADFTPLALGVAAFSISWGVLRFRGFDAVSLTRSSLFEKLETPIVVADKQGRIVDFNRVAAEEFQIQPAALGQVIGTSDALPEVLRTYLRQGQGEAVLLQAGDRWFDVRGNWISEGKRKDRVFGAVLVDVTAKRQAEARLALQKDSLLVLRERERLAQDLHDSLGQQLGFLHLTAQTLRQTLVSRTNEGLDLGLEKISLVAREANDDVRAFLTESMPLRTEGLAASLRTLALRWLKTHDFTIDLKNEDLADEFHLDPGSQVQVLKIIQEALTNARKHSGQNRAQVSFSRTEDRWQIVIEDQGCGFAPDAEVPGAPPSFGLDIMKDRARQAEVRLTIHSQPASGTQVTLEAPMRVPAAIVLPRPTVPKPGLKLLVVDDNALYAEGLTGLLAAGGYEVIGQARDGEEAMVLAQNLQPDVVLLDIQMPRKDGLEVAKMLSRTQPQIKIVMLTASASQNDLFEALRWGASGYLLKNVMADELYAMLDGLARGEVSFTPEMAARILAENHGAPGRAEDLDQLTSRQRSVLELVSKGLTYKEVGAQLFLSEPTIKYHMGEILHRLHLKNREEAERFVRQAERGRDA